MRTNLYRHEPFDVPFHGDREQARYTHERAAGRDYDPQSGAQVRTWVWERMGHPVALPHRRADLGLGAGITRATQPAVDWCGRFIGAALRHLGFLFAFGMSWQLMRATGAPEWTALAWPVGIVAAWSATFHRTDAA